MVRLSAVLVAFGLCLLAAELDAKRILGIVGGKAVRIQDVPWQVSIQYNGNHFCGGSVINKRTILTAAHCVDKYRAKNLKIRMGTDVHATGGVTFSVQETKYHDHYNSTTMENDVAIIRTRSEMDVGGAVQAVDLPAFNEKLPVNVMATISGWGLTSRDSQMSEKLLAASVPIMSMDTCKKLHGDLIKDSMFCAGVAQGGVDACKNDSGGPMTIGKKLVGIISWGTSGGCGRPNDPGVYTNVAAVRDWIDKVANDF